MRGPNAAQQELPISESRVPSPEALVANHQQPDLCHVLDGVTHALAS